VKSKDEGGKMPYRQLRWWNRWKMFTLLVTL